MAEHRAHIEIARPATEVFAFLANPMNLPRWQPMLRESFREGPDRIRVIGGGTGADGIASHVRFTTDHEGRCFSWATATGVGCAGDVQVRETPDGATVELALRLGGRAERPDALPHWTGDAGLDLASALRASLAAVKELCEGATEGVELVSGGTQSDPSQAPLSDSRAYGTSATQQPRSPEEARD
jgi:uncharacterized protein YndB with AHSA1/START domain